MRLTARSPSPTLPTLSSLNRCLFYSKAVRCCRRHPIHCLRATKSIDVLQELVGCGCSAAPWCFFWMLGPRRCSPSALPPGGPLVLYRPHRRAAALLWRSCVRCPGPSFDSDAFQSFQSLVSLRSEPAPACMDSSTRPFRVWGSGGP